MRKLRCIDTPTSKIIKLTIIFIEQRAICWYLYFRKCHFI